MVKKILILLFCTIIFYSCGKKSDPEYKESNIVIFKSIISWWNIEIIIFTLKILIFDLYQIRLAHLFIVKDLNYPFRKAYSITSKIVNMAEKKGKVINELSLEEIRSIDKKINEDVLKVIDTRNSVISKKSYGGTSFENIKKVIKKYKKEING